MWILLVNNRVHQIEEEKPNTSGSLNWIEVEDFIIEPKQGYYYQNGHFIPNIRFNKQRKSWIVYTISDSVQDWGDSSDYHDTVSYFGKFFRKFPILNAFIFSKSNIHFDLLEEFCDDNSKWALAKKYIKEFSGDGLGIPRSVLYHIFSGESNSFYNLVLESNRCFAEDLWDFSLYLFGDVDIPEEVKDGLESNLWDFIQNYGNRRKWSQFFWEYPLTLSFIFVDCEEYFYNELNRAKVLGSPFSVTEIEKMKRDLGYKQGLKDTKLLETRYPRGPVL